MGNIIRFLIGLILIGIPISITGCELHLDPKNKVFVVGEETEVYDSVHSIINFFQPKVIATVKEGEQYEVVDIVVVKDPVYKIKLSDGRAGYVYWYGKNKIIEKL